MIVAISGACCSGKTTFINKMKDFFGDYVVVFPELIRNKKFESIDEIRKYPEKYLDIQIEIINKKIEQEKEAKELYKDKLVFFDRSLIDSFFYLTYYLDKSNLSDEYINKYNKLLLSLFHEINNSVNNIYDKILFFNPINIEQNDKFRPKNFRSKQIFEYLYIKTLLNGFINIPTKIKFVDSLNLDNFKFLEIMFNNKIIDDYKTYNKIIETKCYPICNILMNKFGSIYTNEYISDFEFNLPVLFTRNRLKSDEIINDIKNLKIEEEFMNSRCYPCGVFEEGNIMVVGEAPGVKGRSFDCYDLKPTFTFTKTSFILKNVFNKLGIKPYLTNLLKYARKNNKVTNEDFKQCEEIFLKEIEFLKPKFIIVLGNNTFDYIKEMNLNIKIIKKKHPAWAIYKGISENEYFNEFKDLIYV